MKLTPKQELSDLIRLLFPKDETGKRRELTGEETFDYYAKAEGIGFRAIGLGLATIVAAQYAGWIDMSLQTETTTLNVTLNTLSCEALSFIIYGIGCSISYAANKPTDLYKKVKAEYVNHISSKSYKEIGKEIIAVFVASIESAATVGTKQLDKIKERFYHKK